MSTVCGKRWEQEAGDMSTVRGKRWEQKAGDMSTVWKEMGAGSRRHEHSAR